METPSQEISISILQNTYVVKFPTTGQLIDIESLKVNLTKDTHKSMVYTGTLSGDLAYLAVAAIATFTVLIPKLKEDLSVKTLLDLSPIQIKPIIKAYTKTYAPWFDKWSEIINSDEE